jgi:hypothetical protein
MRNEFKNKSLSQKHYPAKVWSKIYKEILCVLLCFGVIMAESESLFLVISKLNNNKYS